MSLGPRAINVSGSRRASTPSAVFLHARGIPARVRHSGEPIAYIAEKSIRNWALNRAGG